jgi:hypothetical protein
MSEKTAMWNLDKLAKESEKAPFNPPTGTRLEQGLELIRRCDARDSSLAQRAIEAERDGDHECCWACMAARAENKRIRDKIAADVAELQAQTAT